MVAFIHNDESNTDLHSGFEFLFFRSVLKLRLIKLAKSLSIDLPTFRDPEDRGQGDPRRPQGLGHHQRQPEVRGDGPRQGHLPPVQGQPLHLQGGGRLQPPVGRAEGPVARQHQD